ncbi:MAG: phBC6A51 family helix-turn-helix protein [Chloroflexota bacterium]|nr:phBC6A51 family helix-turn-helix protein [Chloroflexota bacterium]
MLCALDEETDEAIAAQLGISRRTLLRWKHRPDFVAARDAFVEEVPDAAWRVRLERAIARAEALP